MRALIHQLALAKYQDAVGPTDLAEAVGDEERGSLAADAPHGPLDLILGGAVDGAGAVVQNKDAGVGEEGAGDGDALPLSAREGDAALADVGLVALVEAGDEVVGLCFLGGPLNLLLRRLGAAEGDVLRQRPREEEDVLLDGGDLRTQRLQVPIADVDAVHQHVPSVDVEDAVDQARQRRLAGARLPDDGDGLAGVRGEADLFQHPLAVVAKVDVFEGDLALNGARHAALVLVQFRLRVDQVEDAFGAGDAQLHQVEGEDGDESGEAQRAEEAHEGDDLAQRHAVRPPEPETVEQAQRPGHAEG